ncbi:RNA exonuclease 3 [Grifola frondosa]|uniref:RNA exonuclease 3 n=1 Tax=Grifola frondosa TaxID=5627 RepID=A0A1C7M544_GRIFR|nr:RNA exonuclease 3 [Grifola frondosa]
MFPTLGLFQSLPCPDKQQCRRLNCIYSHRPDITQTPVVHIPVDTPKATPQPASTFVASTSKVQQSPKSSTSIPAKRTISSPLRAGTSNGTVVVEPPRKLQRTGPVQRPGAISTAPQLSNGVPVLRISPAQSRVPLPVRQAMLKSLYDHFVVLYEKILPTNPSLAGEHALRQEEEVYKKSTKLTYRHAVISSIATLKRRPFPDSASHPSVGTEDDVAAREELRTKMESLRLTSSHLEPYILSVDDMKRWGYVVEIHLALAVISPATKVPLRHAIDATNRSSPSPLKQMERNAAYTPVVRDQQMMKAASLYVDATSNFKAG